MAEKFTNDRSSDCEIRVVYAIDVHTKIDLAKEPVLLSTKLSSLGYGPQKCAMLTLTLEALLEKAGKPKLTVSIVPGKTIQDIINAIC